MGFDLRDSLDVAADREKKWFPVYARRTRKEFMDFLKKYPRELSKEEPIESRHDKLILYKDQAAHGLKDCVVAWQYYERRERPEVSSMVYVVVMNYSKFLEVNK